MDLVFRPFGSRFRREGVVALNSVDCSYYLSGSLGSEKWVACMLELLSLWVGVVVGAEVKVDGCCHCYFFIAPLY